MFNMKKIVNIFVVLALVLALSVSTVFASGFGGGSRGGTFGTSGFGGSTENTQVSYDGLSNMCLDVNADIVQGVYDSIEPFRTAKSSGTSLSATITYNSANSKYVITVYYRSVTYYFCNNSGGVYFAVAESLNPAELGPIRSLLSSIADVSSAINTKLQTIADRLFYTDSTGDTWRLSTMTYYIMQGVDTVKDRLNTIISHFSTVEGYIDQIEGRMIKTVNGTQYTVTDVGYNAWQQLLTVAGYVDGLEGLISTSNSKLTSISGYVDGVEGQLSGLTSSVVSMQSDLSRLLSRTLKVSAAGTEYTLADLGYNTWQQLITMAGYVDGVEGYIDQIEGRMIKTVAGTQYTVTDVGYNAWQQLITMAGYVDGVEGYIDQIEGRMIKTVDGTQYTVTDVGYNAWQRLITLSGYVDGVEGYIDQIEGRMIKTVGDTQYTVTDVGYNAWQQLITMAGYVDGVEGTLNLIASRLLYTDVNDTDWRISTLVYNAQQRLGTVNDKLDTIISNMNQHLTADVTVDIGDITLSPDDSQLTAYAKMIAYGQQDMYSTLGTIAAEYRTATSSQKTNMQSILNKYWLAPGSAQWTIQLSGDQLYDIHRRMIELGYPTRIQYDSNVPGYVIKIVGTPRVSDLLEFANDYTQSTVTVTSNYYLTLTGFLLYSSSKPTNYAIEDFATAVSSQLATINTSIQDNTSDITDALDRLYDWHDHADFTTNVTVNNVVQTYSNDIDNSITMISSILDLFRSTFNFGYIHADFFGATSYFSNLGRDAE